MILLLITTIGAILCILFIPKRIPLVEMYTTSFFATTLGALTDLYLDVKLDLYGFFNKGVDWQYIPIFVVVYPTANFLFLNFFPFRKAIKIQILYIIIFSILTTVFEYISLKTQVFYHNEWKLIYSAICYPLLYTILLFNLYLIRKLTMIKNVK